METLNLASGAKMMLAFFDRSRSTSPVIQTAPQKPNTPKKPVSSPLPRSTPEKEGISSRHVAEFIKALSLSDSNIHSLMVVKNGKVIAESCRRGYSGSIWHSTFSLCKSITGIAIGMLVDEGLLDINTPLRDIFPEQKLSIAKKLRTGMTVRNLLTMTSGAEFAETGAVMYEDWLTAFFNSSLKFDPGKRFNYNSMNSYVLAAVVQRIAGCSLCEYLEPRLFSPLGITEYHWECCPKGIEKGGFGMYLKVEDMAKVGLLLLQGGSYGGRQLISEHWVQEMTTAKSVPETESTRFNYGYQIWAGKKQNSFLMNGLFGQNVIGYKDSGILIATTAGSSLCFHDGSYFDILDEYFSAPVPQKGGLWGKLQLKRACKMLSKANCPIYQRKPGAATAKRLIKPYLGIELVPENPEPSLGVMPKLISLVQNNHSSGIESMRLDLKMGEIVLEVTEGDGTRLLQFGLRSPTRGSYSHGGESYLTCGSGKICLDEDGDAIISLRLDFLENASSRLIKINFKQEGVLVSMAETPGLEVVKRLSDLAMADPKIKRIAGAVSSRIGTEFIRFKLQEALEPVFRVLPKDN